MKILKLKLPSVFGNDSIKFKTVFDGAALMVCGLSSPFSSVISSSLGDSGLVCTVSSAEVWSLDCSTFEFSKFWKISDRGVSSSFEFSSFEFAKRIKQNN